MLADAPLLAMLDCLGFMHQRLQAGFACGDGALALRDEANLLASFAGETSFPDDAARMAHGLLEVERWAADWFVHKLAGHVKAGGYETLAAWCDAGNALTPYSRILSPELAAFLVYLRYTSSAPARMVYPPPGQVLGSWTAPATFSAGAPVDTASYCAAQIEGLLTSALSGSHTVTVSGTNQAAAAATWTGSVTDGAQGAVIALTPTVAGDRCLSVTGIAVDGSPTTGSLNVITKRDR